jgi:hypothetical protein
MENAQLDHGTSFGGFVNGYRGYRESGSNLTFMSLYEYINTYQDEIYYGCRYIASTTHKHISRYQIFVLVDISEDKTHTMDRDMRKKYRKCGKRRREKLDDKYNYDYNTFNRIHAYVAVEHSPGLSDRQTLAINVLCSSNYSDIQGVGSYTLTSILRAAKIAGYLDVVLEVGSDQMEEKDCDDSTSESNDESDDESSDESGDERLEDSEEYELNISQMKDDLCDHISDQLWKKSVRHTNGIPYYSFGKDYVGSLIEEVIDNEETELVIPTIEDDEEYGYGGYYYHKAKRHSKKLIDYYRKFGFKEDPEVHKKLKCFSELAFPAMRKSL